MGRASLSVSSADVAGGSSIGVKPSIKTFRFAV